MTSPWLVLGGLATLAVGYVLVPTAFDTLRRFRDRRRVTCPETGSPAEVGVDAGHAAWTATYQHQPDLRVERCTLWPERQGCAERCLVETEPAQASGTPAT